MNNLKEEILQKDAKALTHSGKFHVDDVFSSALLLYLNPEIQIQRANKVPEDFDGLVYDIGRGQYDHHQRDSRVRENGIAYAAFGLLWEALGADILGEELAVRFDEEFVQPLDNNDNTGEKNELATLIGNFNLSWDEEGSNDGAFFEAVSVAGMILENKFSKYKGNERADKQVEEYLDQLDQDVKSGKKTGNDAKILVMPQFVPAQKKLSETDIEFVIFPSNRGGYCIQPQKKEYSMNYKCSFPDEWLGLENEELQEKTGLASASFCHKGGFLMTVGELEDAIEACRISQREFVDAPVIIAVTDSGKLETETEQLLSKLPDMGQAKVKMIELPEIPELTVEGCYGEVTMEKQEWKQFQKAFVKKLLSEKPEAVYVEGNVFSMYPVIHLLRKKRMTVLTSVVKDGEQIIVRIASGS